ERGRHLLAAREHEAGHADGGRAHQVALQRDAIPVAAAEVHDGVHAFVQHQARRRDRRDVRMAGRVVGDLHRVERLPEHGDRGPDVLADGARTEGQLRREHEVLAADRVAKRGARRLHGRAATSIAALARRVVPADSSVQATTRRSPSRASCGTLSGGTFASPLTTWTGPAVPSGDTVPRHTDAPASRSQIQLTATRAPGRNSIPAWPRTLPLATSTGADHVLPASSDRATRTRGAPSAPVNHAAASRSPSDAIAGPFTGQPSTCQPSSATGRERSQPSPARRTAKMSRISSAVRPRYTATVASPARATSVRQQSHVSESIARASTSAPRGVTVAVRSVVPRGTPASAAAGCARLRPSSHR